jgi:hypothetical protein
MLSTMIEGYFLIVIYSMFLFSNKNIYSPIFMILIPSFSRNFIATETFSNFCERNVGRLLCLLIFFCDNTSMRAIRRKPSDKSVSKLPIFLSTIFRCSFAHLVKVFCWIFFQTASSAKSRSASISSSSSPCSRFI